MVPSESALAVSGLDTSTVPLDVGRIRADFPILAREAHGKPLVYLDNAATTQKPQAVLDDDRPGAHAQHFSALAQNQLDDTRVFTRELCQLAGPGGGSHRGKMHLASLSL